MVRLDLLPLLSRAKRAFVWVEWASECVHVYSITAQEETRIYSKEPDTAQDRRSPPMMEGKRRWWENQPPMREPSSALIALATILKAPHNVCFISTWLKHALMRHIHWWQLKNLSEQIDNSPNSVRPVTQNRWHVQEKKRQTGSAV